MGDHAKRRVLHDNGTLNPHPEGVGDPLFQANPFFDADDLLQVKYEMLRRVQTDGWPVARSAAAFGFSRVTYYKTEKAFREEGLDGLVPRKRGPKGGHKLTAEVLGFARAARAETPDLPIPVLRERLAVEEELHSRLAEADSLRQAQVERARYEAELCRRRYLRVDPDNRLVADALEAQWNEALRALQAAQEDYERQHQADARQLDEAQKAEIRALAEDFPAVWRDPATAQRERKRLLRLVIADVTLLKGEQLHVHLRFRGGRTRTLTLARPRCSWELRQTDPGVIEEIDRLLAQCTTREVAEQLNAQGLHSGWGRPFHARMVERLRRDYGLKSRYERMRATGMLTLTEMAERLDVQPCTVKRWRQQGRLKGYLYSDRHDYLYEPPGESPPEKYHWQRGRRQQSQPLVSDQPVEV